MSWVDLVRRGLRHLDGALGVALTPSQPVFNVNCVESGTIQARHRTPCRVAVLSVYLQQCTKAKVL